MEAMIRIQQKRELENKRTGFRVRKRPVNPEKIKRYKRDHPVQAFGVDKDRDMDSEGMTFATSTLIWTNDLTHI
jgi:hypothetical protein